MKRLPIILTLFLGLLFQNILPTFNPDCASAEEFLVKFATLAPEGSTWRNHMRNLEKVIKEKSKGQVRFRVYAGGVAGDELDVLKKIRIGPIHCAGFSGVGFGQIQGGRVRQVHLTSDGIAPHLMLLGKSIWDPSPQIKNRVPVKRMR